MGKYKELRIPDIELPNGRRIKVVVEDITEEEFDKRMDEWTRLGARMERVFALYRSVTEGRANSEIQRADKYSHSMLLMTAFLDGFEYAVNIYEPVLRKSLRREAVSRHDAERLRFQELMKGHTWRGRPNWKAIGNVLGCSDKTAKARAISLEVWPREE